MSDKLIAYRAAQTALPATQRLIPLYGAGLDNLGDAIAKPLPAPGPDQLLVRHDACGVCFSDVKIVAQGPAHPRIRGRDMKQEPVVMGHEVALTVVAVGEKLRDQYRPGDRFIVQADIYKDGVNYAYGYLIQGGFSEYGLIDQRVLNGDHGNYLIPMNPATGYAESALAEPWACVVAAYLLKYRTGPKHDGTAWFIGSPRARPDYLFRKGFTRKNRPGRIFLTDVPAPFAEYIRAKAAAAGAEVTEVPTVDALPVPSVDDLILLAPDAALIEKVSPKLATFGVAAILTDEKLDRPAQVDVGRIHYERWVYVGAKGRDIAAAYAQTPVRSTLRSGGRCLFVGAGGPIGRMHVQRAIQVAGGPSVIVCTDAAEPRLQDLRDTFAPEAAARGVEFLCVNPMQKDAYAAAMARFAKDGFDDVVVLAPVAPAVTDAARRLAPGGVMNIFAGIARGTTSSVDLSDAALRQTRIIGHSASSIEDLREVLRLVESGTLSTNRSVAAVGSLSATRAGLQATQEARYPGKIVIFPHIREFPLTPLAELKDKLPGVYAKLRHGREWTKEAEDEFLRELLP